MKKLLFAVAGLVKKIKRAGLKISGSSEDDLAEKRLISGKSWEEYCDTLKAAGASLLAFDNPRDPLTQAEGYRYLTRLVRAGLEAFVEYRDPLAPVLQRMVHETVKIGADNPDNYYQNAAIDGRYCYRIYGHRGTVSYLGFSTQKGNYGQGGGLPPTGFLDGNELEIDSDGFFEIFLSPEKMGRNWLPTEEESSMVIVRQTFGNRLEESPADLKIERIGGDGLPSPLTAKSMDDALNTAGQLVAGVSLLFSKWVRDFRKHTNTLPQMPPAVSTAAGGDPKIAYYHSYWEVAEDEALVITASPPLCEYWNFQLNNHWMESLDYRYYTIHLNSTTAVLNPDGTVTVVVAHKDPGCSNWLNTAGHDRGAMLWRWVNAESFPEPQCRLLKLDELSGDAYER